MNREIVWRHVAFVDLGGVRSAAIRALHAPLFLSVLRVISSICRSFKRFYRILIAREDSF